MGIFVIEGFELLSYNLHKPPIWSLAKRHLPEHRSRHLLTTKSYHKDHASTFRNINEPFHSLPDQHIYPQNF